jgi:hypothetical protein
LHILLDLHLTSALFDDSPSEDAAAVNEVVPCIDMFFEK